MNVAASDRRVSQQGAETVGRIVWVNPSEVGNYELITAFVIDRLYLECQFAWVHRFLRVALPGHHNGPTPIDPLPGGPVAEFVSLNRKIMTGDQKVIGRPARILLGETKRSRTPVNGIQCWKLNAAPGIVLEIRNISNTESSRYRTPGTFGHQRWRYAINNIRN